MVSVKGFELDRYQILAAMIAAVLVTGGIIYATGSVMGENCEEKSFGDGTVSKVCVSPDTTVAITDNGYTDSPQIGQNGTVRIQNNDTMRHSVTIVEQGVDLQLEPNEEVTLRFASPGSYKVVSTLRVGTTTTVNVASEE